MTLHASDAREQLQELDKTLAALVDRDPEQEVRGIAIPVLDAIIRATRPLLGDNPVAVAAYDVVSMETMLQGEPVRACDVLLVVRAFKAALGPEPIPQALRDATLYPNWLDERETPF